MRTYLRAGGAASLLVLICSTFASAGPLNLNQNDPDATAQNLDIIYNASNQSLTISGLLASLSPDYPALYNTSFTLTATIPNTIQPNTPTSLSAGTLSMMASINSSSAPVQTLYSGTTALDFAYSDPGNGDSPLFDFIFGNAGGTELEPGMNVGVEVSAADSLGTFYPDYFTQSFNNNSDTVAVADAYNVPEPTGLSLVGIAALGLIRRRHSMG